MVVCTDALMCLVNTSAVRSVQEMQVWSNVNTVAIGLTQVMATTWKSMVIGIAVIVVPEAMVIDNANTVANGVITTR